MLALGTLAAPPGGDRGQFQLLAEQVSRDGGRESEERAGFQDAGAQGVDERDGAGPQCLDHAGRADVGGLVELEGIGIGGVQAAPEHAERLQAGDRAHHQLPVDHRQILALQKHEAEVAGDIGVLEIGFVGRTRGEDGDAVVRRLPACLQRVTEAAEEGGQPMDVHLGVDVGEGTGRGDAVFQRETGARGRLGAVRQHPPGAVRAAADLEGAEVQVMAARRPDADQRPQELRVGGDQGRRHEAFRHQPVLAVNVGQDRFHQIGALDEAFGDLRPLLLVDQHRNMGERPAALCGFPGCIGSVKDAGVAQIAGGAGKTFLQLAVGHAPQGCNELLPDRTDVAVGVHHLVGDAGEGAIAQERIDAARCCLPKVRCRCLCHILFQLLAAGAE